MFNLTKRANCQRRTDGRTDLNYIKASILKQRKQKTSVNFQCFLPDRKGMTAQLAAKDLALDLDFIQLPGIHIFEYFLK